MAQNFRYKGTSPTNYLCTVRHASEYVTNAKLGVFTKRNICSRLSSKNTIWYLSVNSPELIFGLGSVLGLGLGLATLLVVSVRS